MPLRRRQLLQLAASAAAAGGGPWLLDQRRAPAASSAAGDLLIGLISDLNSSYGSTTSYVPQVSQGVRQLLALKQALVACAGDMVAGQKPGLSASQLDAMWVSFARTVLAPVRQAARRFWTPRRQALGLQFVDGAEFPFAGTQLRNVQTRSINR